MKDKLLVAAVSLAGLSVPAHATLMISASISGNGTTTTFTCTDNQAASPSCPGGDTNPATGTIQLANQTIEGVEINTSIQTSVGTPANPPVGGQDILNASSTSLINTNPFPVTVTAAVSDTSFTAPVHSFEASGSGVFQDAIGGTIALGFFNDPANTQGATTPTDAPGNELATSGTFTATSNADAFAFNSPVIPITETAPFSMTQTVIFTLPAAAGGVDPELVNRGQTEIKTVTTAIPEPTSLILMGSALAGFGWLRRRRKAL
jgi:PEP-CTERM motif